jgi:DNA-binding transcriptional ArsR family regulator
VLNIMSAASITPRGNSRVPNSAPSAPGQVSEETLEDLAEVFKLLGDRSRLKILLALAAHGEMHVGALCDLLGGPKRASQPAVSHHLSLLRRQGLVCYRRDGKNNFYRLDSALLGSLLEQFFTDAGNSHKQLQFNDFILAYKRR